MLGSSALSRLQGWVNLERRAVGMRDEGVLADTHEMDVHMECDVLVQWLITIIQAGTRSRSAIKLALASVVVRARGVKVVLLHARSRGAGY